jgi:integrase
MLFWNPSCGFCARMLDELKRWEETRLRRTQLPLAMEGNATMLIWLGKQYLGQTESGKEGVAHSTPLTPDALHALSDARGRSLAVGEVPIFADARGRTRERFLFTKWWRRAEVLAGLEHDQRWGFHSLRRQFATELKDEPLADVAALGGWKSTTTLLACYITADPGTMKRALERRRALADERVESTNGEQEAQS